MAKKIARAQHGKWEATLTNVRALKTRVVKLERQVARLTLTLRRVIAKRPRVSGFGMVIALMFTISCASAVTAQPVITLGERDAESWMCHKYGEYLMFNAQTVLMTVEGAQQRFNPAVLSDRALTNVGLFIDLPESFQVTRPNGADKSPWTAQGGRQYLDGMMYSYSVRFRSLNAGERNNAGAALYFSPPVRGQYPLRYTITAQELDQPLHGSITISVVPVPREKTVCPGV